MASSALHARAESSWGRRHVRVHVYAHTSQMLEGVFVAVVICSIEHQGLDL